MNKSIYLKLAVNNIKKNKTTFFPFGLSCGTMIALFYMLFSISDQASDAIFYGGNTMRTVLGLGLWVCGIFSVLVIFYTNGFLLKRRNKELGLYSVLGMEKKHIGRILFWEIIFTGGISLLGGLLGGLLFSKLMFLVLLNLLELSPSFNFSISVTGIILTSIIFSSFFLVIILYNNLKLKKLNPIELLRGSNVGEREPKAKWLSAILGAICLSMGYYLAVTTENPVQAMSVFFVAVIFVIAGTYLLFMSGSIAMLKILKKNKKYYYHKTHFITVSGMMYRMKQNAVGLANICILSTAVLVVLSSTISLYIGIEDIMRTRFPSDVITNYTYMPEEDEKYNMSYNYDPDLIETTIENHALKYNVEVQDVQGYYSFKTAGSIDNGSFIQEYSEMDSLVYLYFITLKDYKSIAADGDNINELYDNSTYLFSNIEEYSLMESIAIDDYLYKIEKVSKPNNIDEELEKNISKVYNYIYMIVPDFNHLLNIRDAISIMRQETEYDKYGNIPVVYNYNFNIRGNQSDKEEFCSTLRNALHGADIPHVTTVQDIYTSKQDALSIFGSLFFIGIFIGVLFLLATVLIIYYKQISEGYDDRNRFVIMKNVGMSNGEVKKVIKNQILTIFYLPICLAVVHIAFAFDIIREILAVLNLTNIKLFIGCTIGTILFFVAIYGVMYKLTAKSYYKIVNPVN